MLRNILYPDCMLDLCVYISLENKTYLGRSPMDQTVLDF